MSATRYILAATLLALYLTASCSDPDSPVGSGVGPGVEGSVESGDIPLDTAYSYYAHPPRSGGSPNVYVGRLEGVTARGLFRFHRPVLSAGTVLDTSRHALVLLAYQGAIGAGEMVAPQVHRLDFAWTEADSLTSDMLPSPDDTPILAVRTDIPADSGAATVLIDKGWVGDWLAWVDSSQYDTAWTDPNRADSALTLFVEPGDGSVNLLRLRSRSAPEDTSGNLLKPRLYIPVLRDDSLAGLVPDSVAVVAAADLFILEYEYPEMSPELAVGSGVVRRTLMRFDLTDIWALQDSASVIVNRALLTLHVRTLADDPLPSTLSLFPYKLTGDEWLTDPATLSREAFTVMPTAVDTSADSVQVLVTAAARDWVKGSAENHGLLLTSGGEGLNIDRLQFYGGDAADPALRPRLTLRYTRVER